MTEPAWGTYRVRAHNIAADSENKIHDDSVARQYGFAGGLVPGVVVYGTRRARRGPEQGP